MDRQTILADSDFWNYLQTRYVTRPGTNYEREYATFLRAVFQAKTSREYRDFAVDSTQYHYGSTKILTRGRNYKLLDFEGIASALPTSEKHRLMHKVVQLEYQLWQSRFAS